MTTQKLPGASKPSSNFLTPLPILYKNEFNKIQIFAFTYISNRWRSEFILNIQNK